jgi:N-acetylglucosaminyldiphosphoundecaprenol N-acetyl-beta-D-mannosaminyltransferase
MGMLTASTRVASDLHAAPEPISVAGVPVVPFDSYDQALRRIEETVETRRKAFWVAINPQKVFRAWHEQDLLDILNRADVGICDGVGITLAAKVLLGRRIHRVTGCDLFLRLVPLAAQKGWRVFLLGASEEVNTRACTNLRQKYPGLQIVGSQHGYFKNTESVLEQINACKPDLLFVAMGSPTQEYWITRHHDQLNVPFCMGVGGSFDVASGVSRRAPAVFRKTGTEWLYQLITQPHRRLKRQLIYIPFMLRVMRTKLSGSNGSTVWAVKPKGRPVDMPGYVASVQRSPSK